jgi:hypothetical protein
MSAITLLLLSIVFTAFSYWSSMFAVAITALKGVHWFKTIVAVAAAIALNYLWLVGVGLLNWGVLPTHVAFHWAMVILFTALVGYGVRFLRAQLSV